MKWLDNMKSKVKGRKTGSAEVRNQAAAKEAKPAPVAAGAAVKPAGQPVSPSSASTATAAAVVAAHYEPNLLQMVRQAHTDWVCAQQRLNYVLDKDQIDYAIYTLEAAEKRYSMLLKQAKAVKLKADGANAPAGRQYMRISG